MVASCALCFAACANFPLFRRLPQLRGKPLAKINDQGLTAKKQVEQAGNLVVVRLFEMVPVAEATFYDNPLHCTGTDKVACQTSVRTAR